MPQLTIAIPGAPEQHLRVERRCTLGGVGAELTAPALGDAVVDVTPCPAGLVIRSARPILVGARDLAPETPRLIRSGERVRIGVATLVATADCPPEGTRELAGALLAGLDPTPPDGPTLLVVEGPAAGRRFPIGEGLVVGRAAAADVVLDDPLVSRRHARVERRNGAVFAFELASKNGLLVNGERRRRRRTPLAHRDELRIGGTVLVVELTPSAGSQLADADVPLLGRETPRQDRERPMHPHGQPRRAEVVAIASASAALLAAALLLAQAAM